MSKSTISTFELYNSQMTQQQLQQAIARACQARDAAIALAAKTALDFAAYDAAAAKATADYRRTVARAYRRLNTQAQVA